MDSLLSRLRIPLRSMITKLCAKGQTAIENSQEEFAKGILDTLMGKANELRSIDKAIFDSWNSDEDRDGGLLVNQNR